MTAGTQISLLAVTAAHREQRTVTAATQCTARVHVRAYMRSQVYIYHLISTMSTCISFYNVDSQNIIPLEGNSEQLLLLLSTLFYILQA